MSDGITDSYRPANELVEARQQIEQMKADAAIDKEINQRHSALIGKIQATVDKAFPGERWADYDVLNQGVYRILERAEAAERKLAGARAQTPPWYQIARDFIESHEWDSEYCSSDEDSYWLWLVKKLESLGAKPPEERAAEMGKPQLEESVDRPDCSLCGTVRVPLDREGTKRGACTSTCCKDPLYDYNRERAAEAQKDSK